MDADVWLRVKEVLQKALEVNAAERAKLLDEMGVSGETRREVESLLSFDDANGGMMELSAVELSRDFIAEDSGSELAGQRVGHYRIVSELGQGGMGSVYLAERADGKFEQKVALKLLKREMNTRALRRHFEQEREILASLEHPNIARLLDAGSTDDRVPYIAMEYVDGLPIDDYCSVHNLDLNARLELFMTVCAAVDFAHRNLVVHRDLKPSNMIVTRDGVPKLLDFGISKILSKGYEEADSATITRMGVMTPSYASPEQLRRESVTTLSDVYSLGVILFELLSGRRPFESKEGDLREIYSAVLEKEPPLPSSLIPTKTATSSPPIPLIRADEAATEPLDTELEAVRRTAVERAPVSVQRIRGDLDNIVLKAIRKEPERRYASPGQLAEDIRRHLQGLTVTARPNTFSYRATKFISRNKIGVIAAALVLLALTVGLAVALWQAQVAQAERAKAEKRFSDVRQLANSYLFDVYPQVENLEGSLKAREAILRNALAYLDGLSAEAAGDRELQAELATAYEKVGDVQGALNNSSLGDTKAGLDSYAKAGRLREAVLAAAPGDLEAKEKLANNYYVTARTLWNNTQTKEAEAAFEKALKLRRELVAEQPDSAEAKNRLAVLLIDYGAIPAFNFQAEKALDLFDEAMNIVKGLRDRDPSNAETKKTLGRGLRILSKARSAVGDHDGGLAALNEALDVSRELASQFPTDFRIQRTVWLTETLICELSIDRGEASRVVRDCEKTIPFAKNALESEPENGVVAYDLAISYFNTSRAHRIVGQYDANISNADLAIAVMSKLAAKTPDDMEYQRNLAIYRTEMARGLIAKGNYQRAAAELQNARATLVPIVEKDTETTTYRYDLGMANRMLAQVHFVMGEKAKAVERIGEAIAIFEGLRDANALRESDKSILGELEAERARYAG